MQACMILFFYCATLYMMIKLTLLSGLTSSAHFVLFILFSHKLSSIDQSICKCAQLYSYRAH